MILAVNLRLGDDKDIFQEKLAELGDMMALPVVDTWGKVLYRLEVFRATLSFIDLIGNPLGRRWSCLEFLVMGIVNGRGLFKELLMK
jgi:hypothetical protein